MLHSFLSNRGQELGLRLMILGAAVHDRFVTSDALRVAGLGLRDVKMRVTMLGTVALEFSMHRVPFNSEKRSSFLYRLDKGDHRFGSLSPEFGPRAPNPPPAP